MRVEELAIVSTKSLQDVTPAESTSKFYLEQHAALLVSRATNSVARTLDTGSRGQVPDFVLCNGTSPDREVGYLEVTSDTNSQAAAFRARVQKLDWTFPELAFNWGLRTDARVAPRELRGLVVAELVELERRGMVDTVLMSGVPLPFQDELCTLPTGLASLGVQSALAYNQAPEGTGGRISVHHLPAPSGAYSPHRGVHLLGQRIEREASKPDNKAKLCATGSGRSELFIWLDISYTSLALQGTEASVQIALGESAPPVLPEGVTAAWASAPSPDLATPVPYLIRADRSGWSLMEVPVLVEAAQAGLP